MSMLSRKFLLGVAAITFAGQALAADYDAPIFVEQAPEYVPVEIGSGWYLRGDVTYSLSDPKYDFVLFGEETDNMRFGAGLGVGYHFNDWFRADVNIAFVNSDEYGYNDGTDVGTASHSAWSGMVHGYADLGTYAGITPYVGGGVGLLFSRHEVSVDAPSIPLAFQYDDDQYRFAYALNAGLAYKVTNNLSVDVGYQYLSSPDTEYLDVNTLTVRKGVDHHQIKVGLRYDLW